MLYNYAPPQGAQDGTLHSAAVRATRMRDLKAHVVTAEGRHRGPSPVE